MIRQIFFPKGKILDSADRPAWLHFDYPVYQVEAHARSPLPNSYAAKHFQLFAAKQKGQYIVAGQHRQPLTILFCRELLVIASVLLDRFPTTVERLFPERGSIAVFYVYQTPIFYQFGMISKKG